MTYAFVLGRESALSTAELIAAFEAAALGFNPKTALYSPAVLVAETKKPVTPAFFHALGGSIKVAQVLQKSDDIDTDLFSILEIAGGTSLDFGISIYDCGAAKKRVQGMERWIMPLSLELKKKLKQGGRAVRAVIPDGLALSSVQVDKNKLVEKGAELLLLLTPAGTLIARTMAVQAFEDFSERDFGRPAHDARSGMLPPKLARMMVNLAGASKDEALLDPFCGSGTILTEAADLGFTRLVGSDISDRAVSDSKTNFDWIVRERRLQGAGLNAFVSDVKDLPSKLPEGAVAAIVTEPFLGPPLRGDESDQKIHFIYLELMGLYRRAFAAFASVLKPGGAVIFAFPVFGNRHVNLLRELEEEGFRAEGLLPGAAAKILGAPSATGLIYRRPDQRVGRDIFRFRYSPKGHA